ncbi:ester cyclase [Planotetraspora sp. GP83]|uniref:ester cyclase n=1 Tax=Planotetraspora sp. GP83 TaxID=3156264 RepID=UPI003516DB50
MLTAWDVKDRLYNSLNEHDLHRMLEYYRADAVLVTPVGVAEGLEQIAWFYEQYFKAFADLRVTTWYKVACADPAVTEWTLTGTHSGPLLLPGGDVVEGTGRHIAVRGSCAAHVENGKITTHREYYDQLELYSQLGFRIEPIGPE